MKGGVILAICVAAGCTPQPSPTTVSTPPGLNCPPIAQLTAQLGSARLAVDHASWVFEVGAPECPDLNAIINQLSRCRQGPASCGDGFGQPALAQLVQRYAGVRPVDVKVGSFPIGMLTAGDRAAFVFPRATDPVAVLKAMAAAPRAGSTAGSGGAAGGAGSTAIGASGLVCCPGCGPCGRGQCEPGSGVGTRFQSFGCDCDSICAQPGGSSGDCYCANQCTCPHPSDAGVP